MIRTKHKDIIDSTPLATHNLGDLGSPAFDERLRNGNFDIPDKKNDHIKFKNDFCRQVYYLAKLGARNDDVAEFFGVDTATVVDWKIKNSDFMTSWMEGKMVFGMRIAETLGQRALGYDYTETEYSERITRNGNVKVLKKTVNKHMPPEPACIFFYLKNQFKEIWSDVNRHEIDSKIQVDISKKLDITVFNEAEQNLLKGILIKELSATNGVSSN
jgi:hypothetical protein